MPNIQVYFEKKKLKEANSKIQKLELFGVSFRITPQKKKVQVKRDIKCKVENFFRGLIFQNVEIVIPN